MKLIFFVAVSFIFMSGCELKNKLGNKHQEPAVNSQTEVYPYEESNQYDWTGTYKGILPCADCEGIETVITIYENMTFIIKTKYLSKDDMVYEQRGGFLWNEDGNTIILNEKNRTPRQYLIGENYLLQLDLKGNKITGELADKYYLHKDKSKGTH
jgi:uncharacterized lipoprotein NlpE involved in copper resistance